MSGSTNADTNADNFFVVLVGSGSNFREQCL